MFSPPPLASFNHVALFFSTLFSPSPLASSYLVPHTLHHHCFHLDLSHLFTTFHSSYQHSFHPNLSHHLTSIPLHRHCFPFHLSHLLTSFHLIFLNFLFTSTSRIFLPRCTLLLNILFISISLFFLPRSTHSSSPLFPLHLSHLLTSFHSLFLNIVFTSTTHIFLQSSTLLLNIVFISSSRIFLLPSTHSSSTLVSLPPLSSSYLASLTLPQHWCPFHLSHLLTSLHSLFLNILFIPISLIFLHRSLFLNIGVPSTSLIFLPRSTHSSSTFVFPSTSRILLPRFTFLLNILFIPISLILHRSLFLAIVFPSTSLIFLPRSTHSFSTLLSPPPLSSSYLVPLTLPRHCFPFHLSHLLTSFHSLFLNICFLLHLSYLLTTFHFFLQHSFHPNLSHLLTLITVPQNWCTFHLTHLLTSFHSLFPAIVFLPPLSSSYLVPPNLPQLSFHLHISHLFTTLHSSPQHSFHLDLSLLLTSFHTLFLNIVSPSPLSSTYLVSLTLLQHCLHLHYSHLFTKFHFSPQHRFHLKLSHFLTSFHSFFLNIGITSTSLIFLPRFTHSSSQHWCPFHLSHLLTSLHSLFLNIGVTSTSLIFLPRFTHSSSTLVSLPPVSSSYLVPLTLPRHSFHPNLSHILTSITLPQHWCPFHLSHLLTSFHSLFLHILFISISLIFLPRSTHSSSTFVFSSTSRIFLPRSTFPLQHSFHLNLSHLLTSFHSLFLAIVFPSTSLIFLPRSTRSSSPLFSLPPLSSSYLVPLALPRHCFPFHLSHLLTSFHLIFLNFLFTSTSRIFLPRCTLLLNILFISISLFF